jgi:hypothetical protein
MKLYKNIHLKLQASLHKTCKTITFSLYYIESVIIMLTLELQALVTGLAAIIPSTLWLLILKAGAQCDIDARRGREAEALRHLD